MVWSSRPTACRRVNSAAVHQNGPPALFVSVRGDHSFGFVKPDESRGALLKRLFVERDSITGPDYPSVRLPLRALIDADPIGSRSIPVPGPTGDAEFEETVQRHAFLAVEIGRRVGRIAAGSACSVPDGFLVMA